MKSLVHEVANRRLQGRLKALAADQSCTPNSELILRFANGCLAEGLGSWRVHKYIYNATTIARWAGKDLRSLTDGELKSLVGEIAIHPNYSDNTKRDFRVAVKKLFGWMAAVGESSLDITWIRSGRGANRVVIPSNLFTEEDIPRVLAACQTDQERALVSFLYDTGCTAGELLNITLHDVEVCDGYARVRLDGKTGQRIGYSLWSFPELCVWLESHPHRGGPDGPLWVNPRTDEPMLYDHCRLLLQRIKERSGLTKAMYPHAFRHARATQLASVLTEAQMCLFFGWQLGSKMPRVYVHMSGRDLEKHLLQQFGSKGDDRAARTGVIRPCHGCGASLGMRSRFCSECGAPAKVVEADRGREPPEAGISGPEGAVGGVKNEPYARQGVDAFEALLDDPEVRRVLAGKLRELALGRLPAGEW